MGNNRKKKEAAVIHNATLEVADNLLTMGVCKCGGNLFMYLKSQPENYFAYYCTDCNSIGDVRTPKKGDVIWNGPTKVIDYISLNAYGEDEIEAHKEDSSPANRAKRVKTMEALMLEASRE